MKYLPHGKTKLALLLLHAVQRKDDLAVIVIDFAVRWAEAIEEYRGLHGDLTKEEIFKLGKQCDNKDQPINESLFRRACRILQATWFYRRYANLVFPSPQSGIII